MVGGVDIFGTEEPQTHALIFASLKHCLFLNHERVETVDQGKAEMTNFRLTNRTIRLLPVRKKKVPAVGVK